MPSYALVLTAPALSSSQIEMAAEALATAGPGQNVGSPVILAQTEACEWLFETSAIAANTILQTVRNALETAPVDANIVLNDSHRRKRLLIADMDSTIIEQECIDEIADFAGHGAEVAAITERAMRGELDFEAALQTRVALLKGLPTATLERVARERLTITPGARQLVATMTANAATCALVSGGFTFFTSRIAAAVGFQINRANTLAIAEGHLAGHVTPPILGRQAKLDTLRALAAARSIPLEATLAVGDGANDLAMITAAGLGVAFRAKPVVAAEANAQINHSDLTALLYLQGYHRDQFVC